jgi:hypothetical protein
MAKEDPTTARRRKASILLGALMLTPEGGLEAFRERRANPTLDILDVRRARDVLEAICRILVEGGESSSALLEHAWRLLAEGEPPNEPARIEAPAPPPAPLPAAPLPAAPLPAAPLPPAPAPLFVAPSVHVPDAAVDPTDPVPAPSEVDTVMPFRSGSGATPPPSLAAEVAAEAVRLVGDTGIDTPALADDATPSLPFRPVERARSAVDATLAAAGVAGLDVPELTLEQYASLRAELAMQQLAGGARASLLARYGIADEGQLAHLDRAWGARFTSDPALYGRFRLAHDQFLAWIATTSAPRE